jgi:hypothetical protein
MTRSELGKRSSVEKRGELELTLLVPERVAVIAAMKVNQSLGRLEKDVRASVCVLLGSSARDSTSGSSVFWRTWATGRAVCLRLCELAWVVHPPACRLVGDPRLDRLPEQSLGQVWWESPDDNLELCRLVKCGPGRSRGRLPSSTSRLGRRRRLGRLHGRQLGRRLPRSRWFRCRWLGWRCW